MNNKLTKPNIPHGWKKVQLGELANKIGSGITPRGGSAVYTNKGVMLIRSQNVHNDSMRFDDIAYISTEIDEDMNTSRVKNGDILYNISGASIGRSNVFDCDLAANVNQHVCIIRLKEDSPWFVNYWLRSFAGMRELYSFQAGGNREGLNYSQLGGFEIYVPELQEQNRIVKVLRSWDKAIKKLGQMIELKREIKKGLMQKLLTGELRLPGFKNDWVSDKLGAFVSVQSGDGFPIRLQGKKIGKYPFIKVSDMNSPQNLKKIIDANNYIDEQEVSEINGRIFEKQSIVFPKIGAAIATNKKRILTTQTLVDNNVAVLVPDTSRCDGSFLYQWMLRFDLMNWANSGGVPSIRKTAIESHPIIFPELDEQKTIGSFLDTCDEEIEILEKKKTLFLNQKKYLLNNLVTGQIRTPKNL